MMSLFLRAMVKLARFVKLKKKTSEEIILAPILRNQRRFRARVNEQFNQPRKGRDHYISVLNKILTVLKHKRKFYTLKGLKYY